MLERWISAGPFRSAKHPAQSDLDVAHGSNAKAILEEHWDNWITEQDWIWLLDRGFNTVRIPVCQTENRFGGVFAEIEQSRSDITISAELILPY